MENPAALFHPNRALPDPVGFGPLQRSWRPRYRHAGTYDEVWQNNRAPLLPEDFDEAFWQAAPPGQEYPGAPRGGEPVRIEGMHPDGPYEFRLPQAILEAATWFGGRVVTNRFRIVSVTLFGTDKRVEIVWNTSLPCNGRDMQIDRSMVRVRQMAGVRRQVAA